MFTTSPIRIKDKELLKNSLNLSWLDCPWDDDDVIRELQDQLMFSTLPRNFAQRDRCFLLSSIWEDSTANATVLVDSASLLLCTPYLSLSKSSPSLSFWTSISNILSSSVIIWHVTWNFVLKIYYIDNLHQHWKKSHLLKG